MKYVTIAERKVDGRVVNKLRGIKRLTIISETEEWGQKIGMEMILISMKMSGNIIKLIRSDIS